MVKKLSKMKQGNKSTHTNFNEEKDELEMKNTNKATESTDFHAQFLPERRLRGERKFGIEKRQRRIRIESKRNRKLGRRRRGNCGVTGGCFKKIGSPAWLTQEEEVEGGRGGGDER